MDPYDLVSINGSLDEPGLMYGAGYGRSLKSVFFLAEKIDEFSVEGIPVHVLGNGEGKGTVQSFCHAPGWHHNYST